MKLRTFLLILVFLIGLVFTALNWQVVAEPASLNILIGRVNAPLGLLMLGALGVLTLIYLLLLSKSEAAALLEARRQAKDLERARKLADDEEASRLRELRNQLDIELDQIQSKLDALVADRGVQPVEPPPPVALE